MLATGGGAVLNADNRNRLAARGTVVYLFTTVEQQVRRTARDKRRPLIQTAELPESTLRELMAFRDPLYREVADVVVATDGRTVRSVSTEVIRLIERDQLG